MKNITYFLVSIGLITLFLSGCASPFTGVATISYQGNGGLSGSNTTVLADSQSYTGGSSATILANTFYKEKSVFVSWNTAANGSGTAYKPGDIVVLKDATLTLYAQWRDQSALEILSGLTNRLRTLNETLADGTKRPLKEWSTSWDSTGTEVFDYYATYDYSKSKNTVTLYSAETAGSVIGKYEYELDGNSNITKATTWNAAGAKTREWVATYNAQNRYLTYVYYEANADGVLVIDTNRVAEYMTDGINYIKEVFMYASGTDQETDMKLRYVPVYLDNDPSTGIILTEMSTSVYRVDSTKSDPATDVTTSTMYQFLWVNNSYISQQAWIDNSYQLQSTLNYTYAKINDKWEKTSRLELVNNIATKYDIYQFSALDGQLFEQRGYDMNKGKQMEYKYVYSYEPTAIDTQSITQVDTYNYDFTRGYSSSRSRPTVGFYQLPAAHLH